MAFLDTSTSRCTSAVFSGRCFVLRLSAQEQQQPGGVAGPEGSARHKQDSRLQDFQGVSGQPAVLRKGSPPL